MAKKLKSVFLAEYGNRYEGAYEQEVFLTKDLADAWSEQVHAAKIAPMAKSYQEQYYVTVMEMSVLDFVPEVD